MCLRARYQEDPIPIILPLRKIPIASLLLTNHPHRLPTCGPCGPDWYSAARSTGISAGATTISGAAIVHVGGGGGRRRKEVYGILVYGITRMSVSWRYLYGVRVVHELLLFRWVAILR